ncbi:putative alpha-ketoglutarate-dependent sulfonate dioxygenase [Lachnellula occidentalis]|uniref:Putative alpha-ketoglutarate-dependent sulfonate dioxygenase n=1 Tax=Lachnellula occidentalis TaxID=215460 RepID=A0A8H8RY63_9HELO|nr:putative alpha-ketoglutarate-dependent sulfonate dioxygenase [Lachnellula occidentalis]
MAPSAVDVYPSTRFDELKIKAQEFVSQQTAPAKLTKTPMQLSGALDKFESFDVTPVIGKEFPKANLAQWLEAPNADELIRDLAVTVSQRGVVFFRAQDELTNDLQKQLCQKLGELTGKPADSTMHIHPISNKSFQCNKDDEISVISNDLATKIFCDRKTEQHKKKQSLKKGWHSDITFEPAPSDYAILKLTDLPTLGGDTLWASGYEVYDRFSPLYQKFLDGLTATYAQPLFTQAAKDQKFKLYTEPRGSPLNVGDELSTEHPVVRTNPVTGWKTVFAVGHHVQHINGLTENESSHLLNEFLRMITENHDLQVRFKWDNQNDLGKPNSFSSELEQTLICKTAIWDNRSTFHAATYDYDNNGLRTGQRCVGIGERPYFDPASKSKREAEGEEYMEPGEGFTVF